jgi:hypothetical protein
VLQAIVYGKGQSNIIPKLRGTFEPPTAAATGASEQTALQKSIFNAPPSAASGKPAENGTNPPDAAADTGPHGTKRAREEEEEEDDNEVEMEEDESDAPMEEDDED